MASHIADVCNVGRCAALQTRGQAARAYKDLIHKEANRVLRGPELNANVLDSPDFSMRHKPTAGTGTEASPPLLSKLLLTPPLLNGQSPLPPGRGATAAAATAKSGNESKGTDRGSVPDPAERAQALGEAVFQSPVLQVFERSKRQQQQHRVDLQRLQQWAGNHSRRLGLQKHTPLPPQHQQQVEESCDAQLSGKSTLPSPATTSQTPDCNQSHIKMSNKASPHKSNNNNGANSLQMEASELPLPDAFQHFRDRRAQIEKVNAEHGISVADQWASSPRFLSAFRSPVVDPDTGGVDTHTTEMRAAGQLVQSAYERARNGPLLSAAPHAERRKEDSSLSPPQHAQDHNRQNKSIDWRSVQAAQEAQIVEQMRRDMRRLERPQRSGSPQEPSATATDSSASPSTQTFPPGMTRRQWLLRYRHDAAHRPVDSPPRSLSALDRMFVTPKRQGGGPRLTPSPLGNLDDPTSATPSSQRESLPVMTKTRRSNDAAPPLSPPLGTARKAMYDGLRPVATGEYFLTVEQQRIQLPAPRRGYQQPSALFPHAKSMIYDGNNFKSRTVQRRV